MSRRLSVGDILAIPLKDGRFAYGQYIIRDIQSPHGLGCILRVFDIITDHIIEYHDLDGAFEMFPPVSVGLLPAVRSGRWKVIGNIPVKDSQYPWFRYTSGYKPGTYHDWMIWDGKNMNFIGDLPDDLANLELNITWSAERLEERITTGFNPYDLLR